MSDDKPAKEAWLNLIPPRQISTLPAALVRLEAVDIHRDKAHIIIELLGG
jgi:hypothetical protein